VEETWQTGDVVGVVMREADRGNAPEAPADALEGDLSSFATVEKNQLSADPDQEAGEPTIR